MYFTDSDLHKSHRSCCTTAYCLVNSEGWWQKTDSMCLSSEVRAQPPSQFRLAGLRAVKLFLHGNLLKCMNNRKVTGDSEVKVWILSLVIILPLD